VTGIVAGEIRKLTSVRSTWILTLIGWALVALGAAATVFGGFGPSFAGSAEQVSDAVAAAGQNSLIVLVVGLLAMTTEFRHGTAGRTFQITPSRTRVLAAKLLAGTAYAVVFFVGAMVVVAVLLGIGALRSGVGLDVGGDAVQTAWQALVGNVLTVLLGVAFGALVRAQVVAIVVALVWVFFVENLFAALLPDIGRWLPFQALNSLFIPEAAVAQLPDDAFVPLTGLVALAVFTAWVITFAGAAAGLLRYRDV
jgi:ABC-2 type transport system permease protein